MGNMSFIVLVFFRALDLFLVLHRLEEQGSGLIRLLQNNLGNPELY